MTLKDVVELVKKLVQPMVGRHFRKRKDTFLCI